MPIGWVGRGGAAWRTSSPSRPLNQVVALFLRAPFFVICVDSSLDVVVDEDLTLHLAVVEVLGHFGHVHDACRGEAVLLRHLVAGALHAAFSNLHAVERDHKAFDLDIRGAGDERVGLVDRLARRGDVFHHDNAVAVFEHVPE